MSFQVLARSKSGRWLKFREEWEARAFLFDPDCIVPDAYTLESRFGHEFPKILEELRLQGRRTPSKIEIEEGLAEYLFRSLLSVACYPYGLFHLERWTDHGNAN